MSRLGTIRRSSLGGLIGFVLVAGVAGNAVADDQSETAAANTAEALEVAKQAYAAQTSGDLAAANLLYRQSYCVNPDPGVVFNLATLAREQGDPRGSAALFSLYLQLAPDGDLAPDAAAIREQLAAESNVDVDKVAEISCFKTTPDDDTNLAATVEDDPKPPPPQPAKRGGAVRWVGVATAVAGAGLLGGGVFFGLKAQENSDAITNHMGPWTQEILDQQSLGKSAEKKQIVFLAAGGAVAVAGIVMIAIGGPKTVREGEVALAPITVTGGGGLALVGSF